MPPPGVPPGARKIESQGSTFYILGDQRHLIRDAYHIFLKMPWWGSFLAIATFFFLANVSFGLLYWTIGGVGGADGGFVDALSFSVQTMSTIGYGVMHPDTGAATTVMIVESLVSILITALATGLIFAKFSRPTTRVAFSAVCVITTHEGKRTLMFRVGNRRSNLIVEATLHVTVYMTTVTAEGETFYRGSDLPLVRDRQVGMTRGWTVMHVIDDTSPLSGLDASGAAKAELELHISLTGIDDVTTQQIYMIHRYEDHQLKFGHRFADTLRPLPGGNFLLDLGNFDRTVPDATPRDSVRAS